MSVGVAIFIGIVIGLLVGGAGTLVLIQTVAKNSLSRARAEADSIRENARKEAENKAKELELLFFLLKRFVTLGESRFEIVEIFFLDRKRVELTVEGVFTFC